MNILQKIIATLNKEESRFYKLFTSRTNSNRERKDILLFDYIKRHNENYDENYISKKLYKDNKNAFYQLKNRLFKDLNKSMMLQHLPKEKDIYILQAVLLSRVYKRKGDVPKVVCKYNFINKILGWSPKNSKIKKIILSEYIWQKKLN